MIRFLRFYYFYNLFKFVIQKNVNILEFECYFYFQVAPADIEEGMRVGVDRTKYQIHIPLPPKIDPSVTMMTVRVINSDPIRSKKRGEESTHHQWYFEVSHTISGLE